MQKLNGDRNNIDRKMSPAGMAPDNAHTERGATGERKNRKKEEVFNNSPQNAESKQTRTLK